MKAPRVSQKKIPEMNKKKKKKKKRERENPVDKTT